jgi:hypothetical protein
MKYSILLLFGFFLLPYSSFGQIDTSSTAAAEDGDGKKKKRDEAYIQEIQSIIYARMFFNQYVDLYTINYRASLEPAMYYRPPTGMNMGAEFAFKFINFSYQRSLPLFRPDLPDGFKTTLNQVQTNLGGKMFGIHSNYLKYKGLYIMNESVLTDTAYANPDDVRFRQKMSAMQYNLDFRFTFSKKFSSNAFLNQNERQLKSMGAFTFMIGNRYNRFDADSAIIPPNLRNAAFGSEFGIYDEMWSNTVHIMPGFGYIFVKGFWNFGLMTYQGVGLQMSKYFFVADTNPWNSESSMWAQPSVLGDYKLLISYNGKYVFGRFYTGMEYLTMGTKFAKTRWLRTSVEFSIGARVLKKTKEEKAQKKAEKEQQKSQPGAGGTF